MEENPEAHRDYKELLERCLLSIESLVYEIESLTINQLTTKIPTDIIFDSVPILKRLKDAHKLTLESLHQYR